MKSFCMSHIKSTYEKIGKLAKMTVVRRICMLGKSYKSVLIKTCQYWHTKAQWKNKI